MLIVLYLLAVVVVLFVAAVVATREGDVLAPAPPDEADLDLPDGPMQPEDVAEVRFGLTLRGYRMREVDEVLSRLARELAARDRRIGQLEQALVASAEREPEESHGGWADPSGLPVGGPSAAVSLTKDHEQELPTPALPVETSAVARDEEAVHAPVVDSPEPASFDDDFPEVALPEAAAPELPEATDQDEAAGFEAPDVDVPHVDVPGDPAPPEEAAPWFDAPSEEPPADDTETHVPPPALGPPGSGAASEAQEPTGERPPGV